MAPQKKGIEKMKPLIKKNPPKFCAKNTLESPFLLEWPDIKAQDSMVKDKLEQALSGLGSNCQIRAPWGELRKIKKNERKEFLDNYKKKVLEEDPDKLRKAGEWKEAMSHLALGFNCVMRMLEKDLLAGVLVKKNVEPEFLVQTLLPGCTMKNIPIIPLEDLDTTMKNSLGIKHNCMVVGLRLAVKEEGNRFHSLYHKMCQCVDLDISQAIEEEEEEDSDGSMEVEDKCNKENQVDTGFKLTEEQIQSYHLKRKTKGERMFIPGKGLKEQGPDAKLDDSSFLGFGTDLITFDKSSGPAGLKRPLAPRNKNQGRSKDDEKSKRKKTDENKEQNQEDKFSAHAHSVEEKFNIADIDFDIEKNFTIDVFDEEEETGCKEEPESAKKMEVDEAKEDDGKNSMMVNEDGQKIVETKDDFLIDVEGQQNQVSVQEETKDIKQEKEESDNKAEKMPGNKKDGKGKAKTKKIKKSQIRSHPYVSAKTKKIKNNPNRKKNA